MCAPDARVNRESVKKMTNATGGGVSAPSPTSGVRPTPNKHKKETGMLQHNPQSHQHKEAQR